MTEASQASLEIEQTLKLSRDGVERDIARYRIGVYLCVVLLTSVLRVVGFSDTWGPPLSFGVGVAYALALRAYLARYGNPPPLAMISLVLDLTLGVTVFHYMNRYGTPTQKTAGVGFVTFIVGPSMVLMLLINTLRNSAWGALAGSLFAVALYFATVTTIVGFHPAEISVGSILVIAGAIGVAAARQARKTLDSFARLSLLRRYLPPEAVERVMRDDPGAALSLGGRLVNVTLLAADLRGFTAMSEDLSPSEVMAQLNRYHGAMIEVIDRHGGAIDKFIGDGTLVVFGLDGPEQAAAESAVACAKGMLDALAAHNEERVRSGAKPLAMGIAVHTGQVIAGNLGVPGRRLEFTVIGDAVNTVSRLEGQTKGSGSPVIVSAATAALLRSTDSLRELSPVSLRGKQREVRVFGLASVLTVPPPRVVGEPCELDPSCDTGS